MSDLIFKEETGELLERGIINKSINKNVIVRKLQGLYNN